MNEVEVSIAPEDLPRVRERLENALQRLAALRTASENLGDWVEAWELSRKLTRLVLWPATCPGCGRETICARALEGYCLRDGCRPPSARHPGRP